MHARAPSPFQHNNPLNLTQMTQNKCLRTHSTAQAAAWPFVFFFFFFFFHAVSSFPSTNLNFLCTKSTVHIVLQPGAMTELGSELCSVTGPTLCLGAEVLIRWKMLLLSSVLRRMITYCFIAARLLMPPDLIASIK